MAHFFRKVIITAVIIGGAYTLYTSSNENKSLGSFLPENFSPENLKTFGSETGNTIMQELNKPDYELPDSEEFNKTYEIFEGDMPIRVLDGMETGFNIDLDIGGCVFGIKPSGDDTFMVQAENMGKYQCYIEADTLFIKGAGATADLNSIIESTKDGRGVLTENLENPISTFTLYVPQDYSFSKAKIKLGAGVVSIESIEAYDLDFQCGAGKADIEYANVESAFLKCSAGNINIKLGGKKDDYDYTINSAAGTVNIGNEAFSGLTTAQSIQNGADKKIELECLMGSIKLDF